MIFSHSRQVGTCNHSIPSLPTYPSKSIKTSTTSYYQEVKVLYVSPNHYSLLAKYEPYSTNSYNNNPIDIDTQSQESVHSTTHRYIKENRFPLQIFVKGVRDFFKLLM